jgi:hypothetical protein
MPLLTPLAIFPEQAAELMPGTNSGTSSEIDAIAAMTDFFILKLM